MNESKHRQIGINIRPGESTAKSFKAIEEKEKRARDKEAERKSGWTDADHVIDRVSSFVESDGGSYSEILKIAENGGLEDIRSDGHFSFLAEISGTPEEFYQLAKEVEIKSPEWTFKFDVDPSIQQFKYTITKLGKKDI